MKEPGQKGKLAFLEGVRGIAALIVVLHHFGLAFFPAINYLDASRTHLSNGSLELAIARSPLNIFFNGGFAVCIFFILSGFVLSYKFHETRDYRILKTSAVKRYFRLLLPVGAIIIICYLLYVLNLFCIANISNVTGSGEWSAGLFAGLGGIADMLKNIFIDVFFNNDNRYNPVLWTMTIELLGSLLLFSFLALAPGGKTRSYWFHIVAACLIILSGKIFYASFILGSLLSLLYVNGFSFSQNTGGAGIKVVLFCLGVYFSSYPQGMYTSLTIWKYLEWNFINSYELFHVLGAFCIMLVICFDRNLIALFSLKPLLYIGKISFSFYLLHFPVMCSLGCYVFSAFITSGYAISFSAAFFSSLAVTFICSHFYYKWVDKNGIYFAAKIGIWLSGKV